MKPTANLDGDSDTPSPNGRYRIERRLYPDDMCRQGQRLVDIGSEEIVFDTLSIGCPALMVFDTADIAVIYALYRGEAMAYLIDPYRRLFSPATHNMGWQPLSFLSVWEKNRFEAFERNHAGDEAGATASLVEQAGKPLRAFPGKIGPGAPFPFVAVIPEQKPDTCVVSPDGRYRIEGFLYLPNDGRFGEAAEELQRLVDAATGTTIVDEAETGYHATMTFEPDGRVQLRIGGFQARYYLLDPVRRLYARLETPTDWQPLSNLREAEQATMQAEHARWHAGRKTPGRRTGLRRMFFWAALGAIFFGGLTFFPPRFPWWDSPLRLATACPFLLGVVYLLVGLQEVCRRK